MTVKEYINSCLQFAEDTREWGGLNEYHFYSTTEGCGYWYESCDNAEGGLDISWAFNLTAEQIRDEGAQHFVDELATLIRCTADQCEDEQDTEMLYSDLKYFEH